MKKFASCLLVVFISLAFFIPTAAQEYNNPTSAKSNVGITFIEHNEDLSSIKSKEVDGIHKRDDIKELLPKTNDLKSFTSVLLGNILLITCYFILKKHIKGEN